MTARKIVVSLAALAVFAGLAVFLQVHAGFASPVSSTDADEEVKNLQMAFDKISLQNKDLMGQILKLRREHEAIRDDHSGKLAKLLKDVPANKKLAEDGLTDLKKFFEDQNLRVEWRVQSIGITPDGGQKQDIDFGKPVVEAVAMVQRFHVRYRNNEDHNVRQVIAQAEVVNVKGSKVTVDCHCWMDDNSGNRSDRFGMTYVVIARIKSRP